METKKIVINQDEIKRRSKIPPFGDADNKKESVSIEPISFIVCNNEQVVKNKHEKEIKEEYKIPTEYKPPETPYVSNSNLSNSTLSSTDYVPSTFKQNETVSVKISNYPLDMSREELVKLLYEHSKVQFSRFHMVKDRETGKSRGYSFVTVESREKASILIKDLRGVVVDSQRLLGELSKTN